MTAADLAVLLSRMPPEAPVVTETGELGSLDEITAALCLDGFKELRRQHSSGPWFNEKQEPGVDYSRPVKFVKLFTRPI